MCKKQCVVIYLTLLATYWLTDATVDKALT